MVAVPPEIALPIATALVAAIVALWTHANIKSKSYDKALVTARVECNEKSEAHREELASLREGHARSVAEVQAEYEKKIAGMQANYGREIERITNERLAETRAMASELSRLSQETMRAIEHMPYSIDQLTRVVSGVIVNNQSKIVK